MIILVCTVWMVKCIISVVHSLSLLHLLLLNLSILTCGLYLLKSKSDVFTKFVHVKALIENQFLGKIKISNLMEVVSTPLMSLNTTYYNKASSIKLLVLTPLSKMVLSRGNIGISLRPLSHFCHKHLCIHPTSHMLCIQLSL